MTLTPESRFFNGERNCSLMDRLYEAGRLGKKTGDKTSENVILLNS